MFVDPDRFPFQAGESMLLQPEEEHYLLKVLRLQVGEPVEILNGNNQRALAAFSKGTGGKKSLFHVIKTEMLSADSLRPKMTLMQGMLKHDKLDWVIEKATELGVDRIVPLICERSIPFLDEKRVQDRLIRWRSIAKMASQQSMRMTLPEISAPIQWRDTLAWQSIKNKYILWEQENPNNALLKQLSCSDPSGSYVVLVGPEGGFTLEEVDHCLKSGFQAASLGQRILRAETAAVSATALVSFYLDTCAG